MSLPLASDCKGNSTYPTALGERKGINSHHALSSGSEEFQNLTLPNNQSLTNNSE